MSTDNPKIEASEAAAILRQAKEEAKPKTEKTPKSRQAKRREFVKEFIDANTRVGVRIQKTFGFRPYYSLVIGRIAEHEEGESFVAYLPLRAEFLNSKLKSLSTYDKIIAELVREATEWVRIEIQKREDEITQEQKDGKPSLRHTPFANIAREVKNYGT